MKLLSALLIFTTLLSFGQVYFKNPPWENLNCEALTTQTEMNICAYKKAVISDSIMDLLYQKNLSYYIEQLEEEEKSLNIYRDSTYYNYLTTILKKFTKTQADFIEYRISITEFENSIWEGGTISPLMSNLKYLDITVERIKILMDLYNETLNN